MIWLIGWEEVMRSNMFQIKPAFPVYLSGKASTDQSESGKDWLKKGM